MVPVKEYLQTSYSPDCEYVDGVVVERNLGERPHSLTQALILFQLMKNYPGVKVWPEQRIRTQPGRYRIPDLCVTLTDPMQDVFTTPPFIAIEILSPDDRMSRAVEKLAEYRESGISYIWLIDPYTRVGYVYDNDGLHQAPTPVLATADPDIRLDLTAVFE